MRRPEWDLTTRTDRDSWSYCLLLQELGYTEITVKKVKGAQHFVFGSNNKERIPSGGSVVASLRGNGYGRTRSKIKI